MALFVSVFLVPGIVSNTALADGKVSYSIDEDGFDDADVTLWTTGFSDGDVITVRMEFYKNEIGASSGSPELTVTDVDWENGIVVVKISKHKGAPNGKFVVGIHGTNISGLKFYEFSWTVKNEKPSEPTKPSEETKPTKPTKPSDPTGPGPGPGPGGPGEKTKTPTPTNTSTPTPTPTKSVSKTPTPTPTKTPTKSPTKTPTKTPTKVPTNTPTKTPTKVPTKAPTNAPTKAPTNAPTETPVPGGAVATSVSPVPETSGTPSPTVPPESTTAASESKQDATSETNTDGTSETLEATIPEDSSETEVPSEGDVTEPVSSGDDSGSDVTTVIAPGIVDDTGNTDPSEEASGEPVATTTAAGAGTVARKESPDADYSSWIWLLILAIVVIAAYLRYSHLAKKEMPFTEIMKNMIPIMPFVNWCKNLKIIDTVKEKFKKPKEEEIPEELQPKVVNGYLQKPVTGVASAQALRPIRSNTSPERFTQPKHGNDTHKIQGLDEPSK